jgi:hemerythrin superfamily protein
MFSFLKKYIEILATKVRQTKRIEKIMERWKIGYMGKGAPVLKFF